MFYPVLARAPALSSHAAQTVQAITGGKGGVRLWEVYLIFPFMSPLNKPSLLQGKSHSLAKHMDKPGFSGTWEYQSGEQTLAEPAVPVSSVGLS